MSTWALALLSLALSADAAAVAASAQLLERQPSLWQRLRLPLVFGLTQGALCCLGLLGAGYLRGRIEAYDHWLAFALLAGLGLRMIHQARGASERPRQRLGWSLLLALALATSIDALVAGMGLAFLDVSVWRAGAWVSASTLCACALAGYLAESLGGRFAQRAELLGGLTLILIGIGLVLDHTGVLG
jgi:putative Mn2+ efflux pump MntP